MVENTGRKVIANLSIGSYIKKGENGKVLKYYPTLCIFTILLSKNIETTFKCSEETFKRLFSFGKDAPEKSEDDINDFDYN